MSLCGRRMALNCDAPHRGRPPQRPARPGSSSDVRPPVLQTVSRVALVFAPCRFTVGSSGESRLAQPAAMHPKGHPKALKQSFRPSQTKSSSSLSSFLEECLTFFWPKVRIPARGQRLVLKRALGCQVHLRSISPITLPYSTGTTATTVW